MATGSSAIEWLENWQKMSSTLSSEKISFTKRQRHFSKNEMALQLNFYSGGCLIQECLCDLKMCWVLLV
jgi:hypothetical protein